MLNNIKAMRAYINMLERCYSESNHAYKNYGGRGIRVCDEWLNNPTAFLDWHKTNFFEKGQVDRINCDGNYSPENCKMSSPLENSRNRRNTRFLECWGEKKTLTQWIEDPRAAKNLTLGCLAVRIESNWPAEKAITTRISDIKGQAPDAPLITAFNESKTLHEWTLDPRCVVTKSSLSYRLKAGWNPEEAITKTAGKNAGIEFEGKSLLQWSKDPRCKVTYKVLSYRIKKGISLKEALLP